jgi:hypothetical protein
MNPPPADICEDCGRLHRLGPRQRFGAHYSKPGEICAWCLQGDRMLYDRRDFGSPTPPPRIRRFIDENSHR